MIDNSNNEIQGGGKRDVGGDELIKFA